MSLRVINYYRWPSVDTLNMAYHVCPLKTNDIWRRNVDQLKRRLRIFNGRKLVAVAVGDGLYDASVVSEAFDDDAIEYITVDNDPELREVASFLTLLEQLQSTNINEATFYAHTKGNSTEHNGLGTEYWRNAMYHHLLDHVHVCRDLLMTHPCVGTTKMRWPADGPIPYPTKLSVGNWMFAGTFFWFRHAAVFTRNDWMNVPRDRYGAEAWLSTMFHPDEAATVFQPWPANEFPTIDPYDPRTYRWPMRDDA